MARADPSSVTELLHAARGGDRRALDELFAVVYDELRRLAHHVRQGRSGETLRTTALVHEAYVKLLPSASINWEGRAHFFGVAARAMRQVLVAEARKRLTEKRGGGAWEVTLEEGAAAPASAERMVALDDALERLSAMDARQARVVELRFFTGLSTEETAAVLGISTPTVKRDWRAARAWLLAEVGSNDA